MFITDIFQEDHYKYWLENGTRDFGKLNVTALDTSSISEHQMIKHYEIGKENVNKITESSISGIVINFISCFNIINTFFRVKLEECICLSSLIGQKKVFPKLHRWSASQRK